jgi:hypothetical protein
VTIIYKPGVTEGTEWCNSCGPTQSERLEAEINGTPRRDTWKPIAVKLIRKTMRHKFRQADAPWNSSNALIFRRSVLEKIGAILETNGELLPLECADAELWVYNPTNVLDAFDDKASVGERFDDSGYLYMVSKYVFYPDVVAGVDIFKLKGRRVSPTFVSEKFVEMWKTAGLTGLRFDKVWSSDE